MKLETVSIKGVLRFDEAVTLSFRDLPSGLIAFKGQNGEGKSTMLGGPLMGAYRETIGRASKNLLDYVTRADAFIDQTFELEGQGLYRLRLNLDGPHKKAEGSIMRILPDGSQVFLTADSKLTTYDATIAQLLPPRRMLLASSYGAQKRDGSFATIDKKDRQGLFSTLLGHDHYLEMSERARQAVGIVLQKHAELVVARDVLARDATDAIEAELEQLAQRLQVEGGTVELRRRELSALIAQTERRLTDLADAAAAHAAARARADALTSDVLARKAERTRIDADRTALDAEQPKALTHLADAHATEIARLDEQIGDTSAYQREVRAADAALADVIAGADERIANSRKLLREEAAIRAAAETVAQADAKLTALQEDERTLVSSQEKRQVEERDLRARIAELEQVERDLARVKRDAAILARVPCGGSGQYLTCELLTNAAAAKAEIEQLAARVAALPIAKSQAADLAALIRENATAIETIREQVRMLTRTKTSAQALAQRLPELKAAEERIKGHEQRKVDAQATRDAAVTAAGERRDARVVELRARKEQARAKYEADRDATIERFERQREALDLRETAVEQALADLQHEQALVSAQVAETAEASAQAAEQQALLNTYRREWDETTGTLARVTSQREDLERRRQQFLDKRLALETVQAQIRTLEADVVEWQLLQKALGRDGLPVLEIDAAGPTVSAYANDLLQSCGLGRFSIDLVTEQPKATKGKDGSTTKNVFEVRVFDAERPGGSRDLSDLSGGEETLVDEALKSAIALLVNTRHAFPIRTCWRDEATSSLYPGMIPAYMALLRRVHELGGFHQTIFISHHPDTWAYADALVIFEGGGIRVELPPYSEGGGVAA